MTDIERRIDFLQGQTAVVASVLATLIHAAEQHGVGIAKPTAEKFISRIAFDEETPIATQDGVLFQAKEIQRFLKELRDMQTQDR